MSDFAFELDLPPGLNSDDTSFAASGRWADGNNFRFKEGRPEKIGGTSGALLGIFNGVRKLFAYRVSSSVRIAVAGELGLYSVSVQGSGVIVNITPAAWVGVGSRPQSLTMFGDILLASNWGGKLFQSVNGAVATHITQAPSQITAMIVTATRQVMALGCNEEVSGVFNGRCIRWCEIENLTEWTTSSTNNAGEYILDGQDNIVGGCALGEYVAIWTSNAFYIAQFIGDPGQPFRFERIASVGLAGHDAFAVHNQTVFWVTPDLTIYAFLPGAEPAPVPCPISHDFQEYCSVTGKTKIHGCTIRKHSEIWFFYPDVRDGATECSRYVAYCITESLAAQTPVWFRGILARSAIHDSPLLVSELGVYRTTVLAIPAAPGWLTAEDCLVGGGIAGYIETADQYVDSGRRRVALNRFIPDLRQGSADMTVFVRSRPQSPKMMKGPYVLSVGDGKLDFRVSGMIVSVRFEAGYATRLGKPVFEGVLLGER